MGLPQSVFPALSLWVQSNLAIGLFNLLPAVPLTAAACSAPACNRLWAWSGQAHQLLPGHGDGRAGGRRGDERVDADRARQPQPDRHRVLLLASAYQLNRSSMYGAMKQAEQSACAYAGRPWRAIRSLHISDLQATQVIGRLRRGTVSSIEVVDDAMRPLGHLTETQLLQGIVDLG